MRGGLNARPAVQEQPCISIAGFNAVTRAGTAQGSVGRILAGEGHFHVGLTSSHQDRWNKVVGTTGFEPVAFRM